MLAYSALCYIFLGISILRGGLSKCFQQFLLHKIIWDIFLVAPSLQSISLSSIIIFSNQNVFLCFILSEQCSPIDVHWHQNAVDNGLLRRLWLFTVAAFDLCWIMVQLSKASWMLSFLTIALGCIVIDGWHLHSNLSLFLGNTVSVSSCLIPHAWPTNHPLSCQE